MHGWCRGCTPSTECWHGPVRAACDRTCEKCPGENSFVDGWAGCEWDMLSIWRKDPGKSYTHKRNPSEKNLEPLHCSYLLPLNIKQCVRVIVSWWLQFNLDIQAHSELWNWWPCSTRHTVPICTRLNPTWILKMRVFKKKSFHLSIQV